MTPEEKNALIKRLTEKHLKKWSQNEMIWNKDSVVSALSELIDLLEPKMTKQLQLAKEDFAKKLDSYITQLENGKQMAIEAFALAKEESNRVLVEEVDKALDLADWTMDGLAKKYEYIDNLKARLGINQ